jgi:hypothetical protein
MIEFDDHSLRLKLSSKRLPSGNYQVKFTIDHTSNRPVYGYLLAEPGTTLKEVIANIRHEVEGALQKDFYFHSHLYSLRGGTTPRKVVMFNNA